MSVRLYTQPQVTLLSRPEFIEPTHMPVQWAGEATDGERLAEFAGRLCYMSQHNPANRTTEAYLAHIYESGHGSVLEHANYSLLIEGVSRSLTHELVRHRAGFGFSQLSQRFVDEADAAFVVPPAVLELGDLAVREFSDDMERALLSYAVWTERLVPHYADYPDKTMRRKKAREAARAVLPNATETKIVVTGNVRAWRHFLATRGAPVADAEINRLTRSTGQLLKAEAPNFFQDVIVTDTKVAVTYPKV